MTEPLRVMQVCGSAGPGGAERFFLRLVCALARHPEAEVIPVVRRDSWLAQQLREQEIACHEANFGGALDFSTRKQLRRLLKELNVDVAQSWMNRASRFLPRRRVPTVGRLGGGYNLKYYRGLDHLVGNTPALCEYMRNGGWPKERVHHIWNFVDLPPAGFLAQRNSLRSHHAVPDEAPLLLLAGRLHPVKGFDIAIRAFAQLPPECRLLIVGEGEQQDALRELAVQLGVASKVVFAGWADDITPVCAAADLVLVPSRQEALGNVVLEGWAHRLPVIASLSDGPRQLIHDGVDGLLVPVEDADALAAAIRRIIDDPALAQRLSRRGHARIAREFSEAVIVAQYLALFHAMCGR